jgi:hypothetical protein
MGVTSEAGVGGRLRRHFWDCAHQCETHWQPSTFPHSVRRDALENAREGIFDALFRSLERFERCDLNVHIVSYGHSNAAVSELIPAFHKA